MSDMILKTARTVLGHFTTRAAEAKAAEVNMDAEQTRAFKNLVSEGVRNGGKKTSGFYADLPNGDGTTTTVTKAQYRKATLTARKTLNLLLLALAGAGQVDGAYSTGAKAAKGDKAAIKGHMVTVPLTTSGLTAFTDAELDSIMEAASAGGSKNTALSALDF